MIVLACFVVVFVVSGGGAACAACCCGWWAVIARRPPPRRCRRPKRRPTKLKSARADPATQKQKHQRENSRHAALGAHLAKLPPLALVGEAADRRHDDGGARREELVGLFWWWVMGCWVGWLPWCLVASWFRAAGFFLRRATGLNSKGGGVSLLKATTARRPHLHRLVRRRPAPP